ncbi:DUF305 domain-containing protein [Plantactinospora sp. KBS50]|uniref:DUF305 domain-containing protein n=1 Tax=Plantactinospora sp. KBS50 TaxID=2024580 RepID=UPI000BAAE046|nr:DUF305 domain-containing protein [Plantactinospora sp. KBS50]ASW56472.1 DUF305 domain-containing protein [Plantactinospora sp. KBS50]
MTISTDPVLRDDLGGPPAPPAGAPADRRYGLLALTLAVVVGLLIGYVGGWLTPQLGAPGDNSPEAGFARDMSVHHAQAVEMGMIAFQSAATPGVRIMGGDIATGQQAQIGIMQTWLKEWRLEPTGSEPAMAWMPEGVAALRDGLMPGMATPEQMAQLRAARGTQVDVLFCELMITHHLGGIHMVDGILDQTHDRRVVEIAEAMKATQQTDINNLTDLLAKAKAG